MRSPRDSPSTLFATAVVAMSWIVGAVGFADTGAETLVDRGLAAAEIGRYPEALADLEAADDALPAESPRRRDLHFGLGLARYGVEDFAAAVDELDRAIGLDPSLAEPYGWRALAQLHLHEDEAAARDFADCFARDTKMRAVFETFAAEVRKNRSSQPPARSE